MATWLQRAFNKSGTDDPFIIGLLKGATEAPRTLGASALLPVYELANQFNRMTDKDKETKWNYDPFGGQTALGVAGRTGLSAATGGISDIFGTLLNQLGVDNRIAREYNWTPEAKKMATDTSLLDTEERQSFISSPETSTNRMLGQVALGMLGAGVNPALANKSFIPRAAGRFALGAPQGVLGADKNRGQNPLLSGVLSGLTSTVAGEFGDLLGGQDIDYSKLKNIDDVNKLPARQKDLLYRQARNSGFFNTDFSDEKNILTFLDNRKLAGKIPQESLYNIEGEIATQKGLRSDAISEMPGLAKSFAEPVKSDVLERLSTKSGMSKEAAQKTNAWKQISSWIDDGNLDADSVDKAIMSWQKSARTVGGGIKDSNDAQVYNAFAASFKDALRGRSPVSGDIASKAPGIREFDKSVGNLEDLFGFQDDFSKSITQASRKSTDLAAPIPGMLGGPRIPIGKLGQTAMKTGSKLANVAETGLSGSPAARFIQQVAPTIGARTGSSILPSGSVSSQIPSEQQAADSGSVSPLGQQGVSPEASMGLGQQPTQGQPRSNLILDEIQRQTGGQYQMGGQEPQRQFDMNRFTQDLMQAVLAGQISPAQADYAMEMAKSMSGGQSITDQISRLAQTNPEEARQLLAQGVISGQVDRNVASTYADMMGIGQEDGGKLSTNQLGADSGLKAIADMENILEKNAGVLQSQVIGSGSASQMVGGKDYQNYQNAAYNAADLILRIRTGAQANESEIKLYMKEFMPKWFEDKETQQNKLDRMKDYLESVRSGKTVGESGSGLLDEYSLNDY